MAQIILVILVISSVGFLAGDPIKQPCPPYIEDLQGYINYGSACRSQIRAFNDARGSVESKYKLFTEAWTNIANITKKYKEETSPAHCKGDKFFKKQFGNCLPFIEAKSKMTEKEYLSCTDPKIINQIAEKASEVDACYENSRNLVGIDKDETVINFCSYNMPEALKCVKELFKDSTDSPLAGLEVYTNFFVTDFDCENNHDHVTSLKVYNEIVKKHEVAGRQSFFHGYQRASLDFTQYTFKFS